MTRPRTFALVRREDMSGVSGTGVVATGARLPSGHAVLEWSRPPFGINIYTSVEDLIDVHGHDGRTNIEWDEESK